MPSQENAGEGSSYNNGGMVRSEYIVGDSTEVRKGGYSVQEIQDMPDGQLDAIIKAVEGNYSLLQLSEEGMIALYKRQGMDTTFLSIMREVSFEFPRINQYEM